MLPTYVVSRLKRFLSSGNPELPKIFNALGDPGRFRIVSLLLKRSEDVCVTDIARILGTTVPAASQQLKTLEQSGIVRRKRIGQMTCYEVRKDDPTLKPVLSILRAWRRQAA